MKYIPKVKYLTSEYLNHPSIIKLGVKDLVFLSTDNCKDQDKFDVFETNTRDGNRHIELLSSKKAAGADNINPKLVQSAADIIYSHLCNILNQIVFEWSLSEKSNVANIRPI